MSTDLRLIVTSELPADIVDELSSRYDMLEVKLKSIGADAFIRQIGRPDVIVAAPGDLFDAALIDRLPARIGLIASYSTGLDHIDVEAAARRRIKVTNTPDVLTDATADIALALILMTVRGLRPAMAMIEEDRWSGWAPAQIFGSDLSGKVLGLVGGGRIATAVAHRAAAFGMRIAYWSRSESAALSRMGMRYDELTPLLGRADVISLHVPSSPETRDIIDGVALKAMKPSAVLINTGRGDLIDDEALIAALREHRIASAGIDVFRGEPQLHPGYRELDNIVMLPHVGSATTETRAAMGARVIAAIDAFAFERSLRGDPEC